MKTVQKHKEFSLEQSIVNKFIKLGKINFSIEYFIAHFSQFPSAVGNICLMSGRLGTAINPKHLRDFLKIKLP